MEKLIMSIETIKIKDFIFSTNKLKVIRGASYLLDYLNQVEVPRILEENGVTQDDIIYVGAGNAKFFITNHNNSNDKKRDPVEVAEKIKKEVEEVYFREAPGVKLAIAYKETAYGTEKDNGKKVWEDIDDLAQMVAIQKSKGFPILNIDLPFVEKCDLCGTEMAEVKTFEDIKEIGKKIKIWNKDGKETIYAQQLLGQINNLANKDGKVCECCFKKIVASNEIKNKLKEKNIKEEVNFYHYLINKDKDGNLTKHINKFDTIEEYAGEKSFIGFVYADGDGLGDFLKNAAEKFKEKKDSESKYIKFLKEFSKNLDQCTKESLLSAFKELPEKDRKAEFLIVGGDDVCAVFKPAVALKISYLFQKKFEDNMKNYTKQYISEDIGITSSSGVIIAKAKTPMFHLFEQALSLQKNAKAKRHELQVKKTGFIDFQVIGSEGCVNINNFRKKISHENNPVVERPYAINREKLNIKNNTPNIDITNLIEIIDNLKKKNFPKTKLRYIYDLKRNKELVEFEKKMEFINVLSKMDKKHIKLVKDLFEIDQKNYDTFDKLFTNIFDILEMYDFIGGEKVGN